MITFGNEEDTRAFQNGLKSIFGFISGQEIDLDVVLSHSRLTMEDYGDAGSKLSISLSCNTAQGRVEVEATGMSINRILELGKAEVHRMAIDAGIAAPVADGWL
ncbi:hypothetical protein SAMN04489743_2826 [Pseudarthrobacter equi]|uniref:Uncharacterized protein n=1 Tax=Pseudarthrobacter equi TaxID=728066 RepID=A0A1H2A7G8_9MICC|nr:hypothetical protein [Pseudarthrobacter equi]SDT41813.1 hypothetical protein SAMN04489743_2826 [Pseudarthrobacter equi]